MERKNFNEAVLDSLCLMCNQTFVPREDALDVLRKRGVPNPERTFALLGGGGKRPVAQGPRNLCHAARGDLPGGAADAAVTLLIDPERRPGRMTLCR